MNAQANALDRILPCKQQVKFEKLETLDVSYCNVGLGTIRKWLIDEVNQLESLMCLRIMGLDGVDEESVIVFEQDLCSRFGRTIKVLWKPGETFHLNMTGMADNPPINDEECSYAFHNPGLSLSSPSPKPPDETWQAPSSATFEAAKTTPISAFASNIPTTESMTPIHPPTACKDMPPAITNSTEPHFNSRPHDNSQPPSFPDNNGIHNNGHPSELSSGLELDVFESLMETSFGASHQSSSHHLQHTELCSTTFDPSYNNGGVHSTGGEGTASAADQSSQSTYAAWEPSWLEEPSKGLENLFIAGAGLARSNGALYIPPTAFVESQGVQAADQSSHLPPAAPIQYGSSPSDYLDDPVSQS